MGIIMSSDGSFKQYIIELCKRCNGLCIWILRTFSSRECILMMTLFKSSVLSRPDYGSRLWSLTKCHQIIMSSDGSFEQYIIELCKRCNGLCIWILRTFSSRECILMMTLFKSSVLSRPDYGSRLWSLTKCHQIIMSSDGSFEQYIIELCKRCNGLCIWILRTFSSRECILMMTLFKSSVLSRPDYGSRLWSLTKCHQIIMNSEFF